MTHSTALTLRARHWYSWDFVVHDTQQELADIDMTWWREKGTLEVADRPYRVYREGLVSGDFVLESSGEVLARAVKPSAFRRAFEIKVDGQTYILRARGVFRRDFVLERGTTEVGSLEPVGFLRRTATVTLPDSFQLPVKVFIMWLTLLIWKRESDGGAAGGA